jgi:two-component sensor histidine kinase
VLLRELAHRVKNTLALIMAMARQTGLSAADLAGFLDAFEGRLQALSAVHDLVSEAGWRSTSLADLAQTALAPHDEPGGGRVTIDVEELPINPAAAQNLVLALHELATNAAKHGALSAPGGTVALEARVGVVDGRRRARARPRLARGRRPAREAAPGGGLRHHPAGAGRGLPA